MKFLTNLTYILISFLTGTFFLGLSFNLIDLQRLSSYLQSTVAANFYYALILALLGILIILFCLRHIQYLVFRSIREKSITLESADGKVSVTLLAIEELIRKLLESQEEISHIKPRITITKKGLDVEVKSNLNSAVNLLETTKNIQEKVKNKLQRLLGEDKNVRVTVAIKKIILSGKAKSEEEPPVPFRNY